MLQSKELIKLLKNNDWQLERTNGSHHTFKNSTSKKIITVPHPKKDIPKGTLQSILKTAGL